MKRRSCSGEERSSSSVRRRTGPRRPAAPSPSRRRRPAAAAARPGTAPRASPRCARPARRPRPRRSDSPSRSPRKRSASPAAKRRSSVRTSSTSPRMRARASDGSAGSRREASRTWCEAGSRASTQSSACVRRRARPPTRCRSSSTSVSGGRRRQRVEQRDQHAGAQVGVRRLGGVQRLVEPAHELAQRGQHRRPQPRPAVVVVELHPRHPLAARRPLRQQRRLAEPRGRGDVDDPRAAGRDRVEQPRALDVLVARAAADGTSSAGTPQSLPSRPASSPARAARRQSPGGRITRGDFRPGDVRSPQPRWTVSAHDRRRTDRPPRTEPAAHDARSEMLEDYSPPLRPHDVPQVELVRRRQHRARRDRLPRRLRDRRLAGGHLRVHQRAVRDPAGGDGDLPDVVPDRVLLAPSTRSTWT